MKPLYLLAGNPGIRKKSGDRLTKKILQNSGVDHPSIAYIGAASNDNRSFYLMFRDYMQRCGAGEVILSPLACKRVDLKKTLSILESADMVFISGGDVEKGMKVLEEKQILPFLRGLFENGKPFFGISAGSIMLGQKWIRWKNPEDDLTASLFPCMGFAPIILDTHGEEEEWEELRELLEKTPEGTMGYGIPAGSGLCIHPDGTLEPLGGEICRFIKKNKQILAYPDDTIDQQSEPDKEKRNTRYRY